MVRTPFCRNCGREIIEDAFYCPYCSFSQKDTQSTSTQPVFVSQSGDLDNVLGAIVLIALLIGGIWFIVAVELFDCPSCGNDVWVRWACSYCGYDGKVTLAQLILYSNG